MGLLFSCLSLVSARMGMVAGERIGVGGDGIARGIHLLKE
jgi:hypothetical protein